MTTILLLLVGFLLGTRRLSSGGRIPNGFCYHLRWRLFTFHLYLRWPERYIVIVGWSASTYAAGPMFTFIDVVANRRIEKDWTWFQTPAQRDALAQVRAKNERIAASLNMNRST